MEVLILTTTATGDELKTKLVAAGFRFIDENYTRPVKGTCIEVLPQGDGARTYIQRDYYGR